MFLGQLTNKRTGLEIEVEGDNMTENPIPMHFNLIGYCPALIALWKTHTTYQEGPWKGRMKFPEEINDFGINSEIIYDPKYRDTAIGECDAPVIKAVQQKPGHPYIEVIEATPTHTRLKIKCGSCKLQRGGFSKTERIYHQNP